MTELNLVCGEEGKVAWVGSAYMFGLMVGSFLCGFLADKFGRLVGSKQNMFEIISFIYFFHDLIIPEVCCESSVD